MDNNGKSVTKYFSEVFLGGLAMAAAGAIAWKTMHWVCWIGAQTMGRAAPPTEQPAVLLYAMKAFVSGLEVLIIGAGLVCLIVLALIWSFHKAKRLGGWLIEAVSTD